MVVTTNTLVSYLMVKVIVSVKMTSNYTHIIWLACISQGRKA